MSVLRSGSKRGLAKIQKACGQRKQDALKISHRVGKLMGQNTRAAGAFKTQDQDGWRTAG